MIHPKKLKEIFITMASCAVLFGAIAEGDEIFVVVCTFTDYTRVTDL